MYITTVYSTQLHMTLDTFHSTLYRKMLGSNPGLLQHLTLLFCMYFIKHWFICRPSDSTVSEDAEIEPRTVATSALAVRSSNHSAKSHPLLG